jgi:hypothetical protein
VAVCASSLCELDGGGRARIRGSGINAASIGARIWHALVLGAAVLALTAGPARSASSGPSPDRAPPSSAGSAPSPGPVPDPAPQAHIQPASTGSGGVTSSGSEAPPARLPSVAASRPNPVTPVQVGGSEVVAPGPTTHATVHRPSAPSTRTRPAHTEAARSHRTRAAPDTRRRHRDLLSTAGATLFSVAGDRHNGLLLLLSSLAMAVLALAGLSLARVLKRAQAEWCDWSLR